MHSVDRNARRSLDLSGLVAAPSNIIAEFLQNRPSVTIAECSSERDMHRFMIARDILPPKQKGMRHPYTFDEYVEQGARLFLTHDSCGGFGLRGNELISLFSLPGYKYGNILVAAAKERGAEHLCCFDVDGRLLSFYGRHGFREVARELWNPQCAPPNWNYQDLGTPDVVTMSLCATLL